MRILFFTQLFYPAIFGGGEYIFHQWATELVKKGHEVFVITQKLQNTKSNETINGIQIFRVGSELNLSGTLPIGIGANLSFLIQSFVKGIQIARKHKIDIIHSNTYVPVISASMASSLLNIPHVATVHDVYYTSKKDFWKEWSSQAGISKSMKLLGPMIEKIVAKMPVSIFHTVSETSKNDLKTLGVSKEIIVIPNGIDVNKYTLDNNMTKNQAIFVGRLVFYKNTNIIIEAFSKVVKKIPDSKLVIVGDGPLKQSLENKVKSLGLTNVISLKGNVSHEEKIRLLHESQILLNPSLIEGFGIVVLEGFACGKPVIVSDSKPLSNLVDDGIDGFIVPSDKNRWADFIIELFSNPQKAEEMGRKGREKTLANFEISKLAADLIGIYEKCLKK